MQSLKNFVHDTTMNHVSWKWEAVYIFKIIYESMAWWKMEKSTKAKLGNAVSRHAQSAYNLQSIQSQCLIAVLHQHGPCQLRLISSNMLMLLCWCSGMWLSSVHVSSWYYILIAKADVIKLILKHGNVKWSNEIQNQKKTNTRTTICIAFAK